jgi:large subunit ribosomal protein L25
MAVTLNARSRDGRGKGDARKLRQAGEVPAVAYGHGQPAQALAVDGHALELLLGSINPENTIINLTIDGGRPSPALIREVQHHPSRPIIFHVDFFQIRAGEKLTVAVPVRLHGTPVGVHDQGGVLQEILRELSVECLPGDIPASFDLDVSGLELGQSLHVSEVSVESATILNDGELVICTVTTPSVAALPEDAVTEEGIGGEVEPELIRDRTEDGEDVPFEHGSAQPE